jgi:hypothetical protein
MRTQINIYLSKSLSPTNKGLNFSNASLDETRDIHVQAKIGRKKANT